ncbi:LuxR family transcriptional regulator [Streptomyces sp. Ru73]|uniref:helix-turn-helix transcriptional regulator n=1 Tax=Streptomyces sp. Ru73 TaxID=2080748 RepID=UPI0021565AA9|nr:LuxR family transcriptional regulator [Streptomyces sp. Ru73]
MLCDVEIKSVSRVFVGRSGELGLLGDALTRTATTGEPQALLIGGEAGVGKTRLIEEFAAAARAAGALVAVGGCIEIGSEGLPFAPFSAILRTLHARLPEELAAAVAGQEGELARILPELAEAPGESRDDEHGRARLFELTARLLERLARDRSLVIVVEDLHWADRSTRELLGYLLHTLHDAAIVLVATYRSDDVHRRHPLRPFLAEIDRMRTVRRAELARFNRDEVRSQMAGITGSAPEEALVARVFERSEGNAFFVEELACSIHDGTLPGLSDSLRDLLLVRVEALPEHTQRVVRTAAVGGSTVEHDLLSAVAGLPEDDLIEALRGAVGSNTLVPTSDGTGYRFRHALVREAVLDDLLPGERTRLNRRYAEALEADPGLVRAEACAPRLASYWYHARDAAKALPAVLTASVTARRRHAHAEQLRLLDRALELWDEVPKDVRLAVRPVDCAEAYPASGCDDDALRYLDLLAEIVVAARLSGDRERAYTVAKRALRTLAGEHDPLREAWFLTQRSRLVQGTGRGDGWDDLRAAQELVRGLPPSPVHAAVLAQAAAWGALHEPGPDSFTAAERAVELARLVGEEEVELNARITLHGLQVFSGDADGGLAGLREALDRALERGFSAVVARGFTNLPSCLETVGRSREAVTVTERGLAMTDHFGLKDSRSWVYGNLAESLLSLGRWAESAEAAAACRRLALSSRTRALAASRHADLALRRGDVDAAAEELSQARRHFGSYENQPQYTLPMARFAYGIAVRREGVVAAREVLEPLLSAGFPADTYSLGWPLLWRAAAAEADARGLPAAAEGRDALLARLAEVVKTLPRPVPVWQAYGKLTEAELCRAGGRPAPDRWAEAVAALRRVERPYELAWACLRWAEALLSDGPMARGPREAATALLADARAAARWMGADPLTVEIDQLAVRARLTLPETDDEGTSGTDTAPAPDTGAVRRRTGTEGARRPAITAGAVPAAVTGAAAARTTAAVPEGDRGLERRSGERRPGRRSGRPGDMSAVPPVVPAPASSAAPPAASSAASSGPSSGVAGERAAGPAGAADGGATADSLGLTPRERDVLRLVAAGRSNRQIADALFISPKTASVHVSNILAKLGVSGRGEAGALAHRLRLFPDAGPA